MGATAGLDFLLHSSGQKLPRGIIRPLIGPLVSNRFNLNGIVV